MGYIIQNKQIFASLLRKTKTTYFENLYGKQDLKQDFKGRCK